MKIKTFLYRLFFTKDDGLDVSQFVLLALYIVFGFVVVNSARGVWTLDHAVLHAFVWVFGVANINAAPQWIALELIRAKSWEGIPNGDASTDLKELRAPLP